MENKKPNSAASKFGTVVGTAIVGAAGACIVGSVGALTIKFLTVLIAWLF